MVFLRTDDNGRVTLRHNRPEQLDDTSDGVTVDSVPERPDGDHELFVVDGSPEWKPARYRYRNDLDGLKRHLRDQLKEKRHEVETQGVTVNGPDFRSDRETRQSVVETLVYARSQDNFSTKWKTPSGFVTVSQADLEAVRAAIASLRQQAFEREAELAQEIEDATSADSLLSIDFTTGWP